MTHPCPKGWGSAREARGFAHRRNDPVTPWAAGGVRVSVVAHESLVIILATGGSPLGRTSLAELPQATVRWQRVECEGSAACVAARVDHPDPPEAFAARIRGWGRARGWAITVAPSGPPG